MVLNRGIIQKANAQAVDTLSYPTIPFTPPGGGSTPTPIVSITTTPVETGPIIKLEIVGGDPNFDLGDTGEFNIVVDSKGQTIQSYTILLEFDPTHIQITDAETILSGIQIQFLDTFFESEANQIETNILDSQSGLAGRITLVASSPTTEGTSFSSRTIARVPFKILSRDTSEIIINDESTLVSNQTNILDIASLDPITLNSGTTAITTIPNTTSTTSITTTPGITITPKTSIGDAQGTILVNVGLALLLAGIALRLKSKQKHM